MATVVATAEREPDVWATVGIHPHEADAHADLGEGALLAATAACSAATGTCAAAAAATAIDGNRRRGFIHAAARQQQAQRQGAESNGTHMRPIPDQDGGCKGRPFVMNDLCRAAQSGIQALALRPPSTARIWPVM